MRVLVVGGGGREHALAWALSRDKTVTELFAAPGNPGISEVAKCVPINANKIEELADFARTRKVDLTVVGPEAPLALGMVDTFRRNSLAIFGPDQRATRIESSKSFAKELCARSHVPVPRWKASTKVSEAVRSLDEFGPPWVIKADGLMAGKGTVVTRDRSEAEDAIKKELQRENGKIVLEEFIDGWEATFMATVSSGQVQWIMPVVQDYKPAYDDDTGPNTGGMGGYTPVPEVTPALAEKVNHLILSPVVKEMEKAGIHYQGVLNLNAIVRRDTDDPLVLEFNARFGDPEAQAVMKLVTNGLADHLRSVADAKRPSKPDLTGQACVVVVLASKGYPTSQSLGERITIRPGESGQVTIFHAGTARNPAGELVTAGGRVLNIAAAGDTLESARRAAYSAIETTVQYNGMQYRSDIGATRKRERRLQVSKT